MTPTTLYQQQKQRLRQECNMRKNKFKNIAVLSASAFTVVAPIAAVVSCSANETKETTNDFHAQVQAMDRITSGNPNISNRAGSPTDPDALNPYLGATISRDTGESYGLKSLDDIDPMKWQATPIEQKNWSKYNGKYAYWYAAKNGWTVGAYQEFIKWVYNTRYKGITHEFATSPWNLFYQTFIRSKKNVGSPLHEYNKNLSNVAHSRWENALNYMDNNIEDKMPWYAVRVDEVRDKFFSFDNNNLINAWERMKDIGLLQVATFAEVQGEQAKDGTARNHYLVNGKFVAKAALDSNLAYYKVSKTGSWGQDGGSYVRDDNGWISYVALSKDTKGYGGSGSHAFGQATHTVAADTTKANTIKQLEGEIKNLFFYNATTQSTKPTNKRDYTKIVGNDSVAGHVPVINPTNKTENDAYATANGGADKWENYSGKGIEVVYPSGYTVNHEFSRTNDAQDATRTAPVGMDNSLGSESFWQGKYTLVQAAPTWTDLLHDETVVFPYEHIDDIGGDFPNNGQTWKQSKWSRPNATYGGYYSGEHGSWAMWAWVEDGAGGHKVYKCPDFDYMMNEFRKDTHDPTLSVFYGNANWVTGHKAIYDKDSSLCEAYWWN